MIDLSKFDPSAPWYEYLKYKAECEKHGEEDSVQTWMEERGDLKKPKRIQKKVAVKTAAKTTLKKPPIINVEELLIAPPIDDPKTRAVEILYEGKAYPSITAAAKANGVSPQTISRRLGRYSK